MFHETTCAKRNEMLLLTNNLMPEVGRRAKEKDEIFKRKREFGVWRQRDKT